MNDSVKRLAVTNGPNIFQMLLVILLFCTAISIALIDTIVRNVSITDRPIGSGDVI